MLNKTFYVFFHNRISYFWRYISKPFERFFEGKKNSLSDLDSNAFERSYSLFKKKNSCLHSKNEKNIISIGLGQMQREAVLPTF